MYHFLWHAGTILFPYLIIAFAILKGTSASLTNAFLYATIWLPAYGILLMKKLLVYTEPNTIRWAECSFSHIRRAFRSGYHLLILPEFLSPEIIRDTSDMSVVVTQSFLTKGEDPSNPKAAGSEVEIRAEGLLKPNRFIVNASRYGPDAIILAYKDRTERIFREFCGRRTESQLLTISLEQLRKEFEEEYFDENTDDEFEQKYGYEQPPPFIKSVKRTQRVQDLFNNETSAKRISDRAAEYVKRGMSPSEALDQARIDYGDNPLRRYETIEIKGIDIPPGMKSFNVAIGTPPIEGRRGKIPEPPKTPKNPKPPETP